MHYKRDHHVREGNAPAKAVDPGVPPAKMAKFPTETAAKPIRFVLSCAVDHVPVALLNTSTKSE